MTVLLAIALAAAANLRAVVYPDRAQVTRAATADCGPRGAAVVFDGVTPAADVNTFRAASADGAVMGIRSELRAHEEAFTPQAQKLDADIRKLEVDQRALLDAKGRAGQKARVADALLEVATQLISREMVEPKGDAEQWKAAFEASQKARLSASASSVDANAKLREVQRKLAELQRKRGDIQNASQRRSYRVEVIVGCDQGETAHAELSYIVGGAHWEPTYEARADEKSGKVELSMFATVRQATGEDWKHAQVLLSTAIPRADATPPEVTALKVGAAERKAEKKVIVRRDEEQRHAEAAGQAAAGEGEGMEVAAQGLSVQLKVKDLADLNGDGTPARLFVGSHKLNAKFAWRAIPKLMPYVFRVADVVNTAPFALLPGPLDAFRRNGFIARTAIERIAEGQKFHLTFGVEENLKVKRHVLEEIAKDAGLFGQNKRFKYAYRYELQSHLDRAETVELSDHIPVSELDDVKVEIEEKTTKPAELEKSDGIVTWKVQLPAGQKKTVELAFHVEVPGSYDSGGM